MPATDTQRHLKDLRLRYYKELTPLLRVPPGGRDILDRVASMGLQVVLATSAPEDELSILRDVLDRQKVVSEVTSAGDVDIAKPNPDIVEVGLARAGVTRLAPCLSVTPCETRRPAGGPASRASACSAAESRARS